MDDERETEPVKDTKYARSDDSEDERDSEADWTMLAMAWLKDDESDSDATTEAKKLWTTLRAGDRVRDADVRIPIPCLRAVERTKEDWSDTKKASRAPSDEDKEMDADCDTPARAWFSDQANEMDATTDAK
jgi:hypothetical protein